MGIFQKLVNRISNNYDIRDMNDYYNIQIKEIDYELKNKNSVKAFQRINKLFKYKWLKQFPNNHLFEKNEKTKASLYAQVCQVLDSDGKHELALKAYNYIPSSSPQKALLIFDMSPELSDLIHSK